MAFVDAAKAIVCNIIAVALAMTVSAVAALLPGRSDWLERVDQLALQLKAIYEKDRAEPGGGPVSESVEERDKTISEAAPDARQQDQATLVANTERLLKAYDSLWQFVHDIRSEGLLLDDRFCERVERDWSVRTLMSYMRSADKSLQDKAGKTLDLAASYLAAEASDKSRIRAFPPCAAPVGFRRSA